MTEQDLRKEIEEKEKIEMAKVCFPQTEAGNKMLKAIIKRAKQQSKEEFKKMIDIWSFKWCIAPEKIKELKQKLEK